MKVMIIGAGYVGTTLAVVSADFGHEVVVVESDQSKLKILKSGRAYFYEPLIDSLLKSHSSDGRLQFSDAVSPHFTSQPNDCLIVVITMGTPMTGVGEVGTGAIERMISNDLLQRLRPSDVIVLRSTVEIGFTDKLRERYGIENLAFCPERTVEGRALKELTELPQIISASNEYTYQRCVEFFGFSPKILRASSHRIAESVKLICNSYRDWQFGFGNLVALISQHHNLDVQEVISSANFSYPRSSIPNPGLCGGPCLEKDPFILSLGLPEDLGLLLTSSRKIHQYYFNAFASRFFIQNFFDCPLDKSVLILGAAFKGYPVTSDTRGSFIFPLLSMMESKGFSMGNVTICDPAVQDIAPFKDIIFKSRIDDLDFLDFDLVILMTDAELFKSAKLSSFRDQFPERLLNFWPNFIPQPKHVAKNLHGW